MKKTIAASVAALAGLILSGCASDASVVSENLSTAADQFEVPRRIVFVNGITDEYLLVVEGFCSIEDEGIQLEVTCKDEDGARKHFLGLSDNVTYVAEQVAPVGDISEYRYRVIFKPESLIPAVDLETSLDR